MDLAQAFDELQRYTKGTEFEIYFDGDGEIIKRSKGGRDWLNSYTAEELAARISKGHERRCHEELVAAIVDLDTTADSRIAKAFRASKKALAQREE